MGPLPLLSLQEDVARRPIHMDARQSGQHLPLSTGGANRHCFAGDIPAPLLATCINSSTCGPARRLKATNETDSAQFVGLSEMSRVLAAIPDWSGFYLVHIVMSVLYITPLLVDVQ